MARVLVSVALSNRPSMMVAVIDELPCRNTNVPLIWQL
jgi:hypothetical protein